MVTPDSMSYSWVLPPNYRAFFRPRAIFAIRRLVNEVHSNQAYTMLVSFICEVLPNQNDQIKIALQWA